VRKFKPIAILELIAVYLIDFGDGTKPRKRSRLLWTLIFLAMVCTFFFLLG